MHEFGINIAEFIEKSIDVQKIVLGAHVLEPQNEFNS